MDAMTEYLAQDTVGARTGNAPWPGSGRFVDLHCHCAPGLDDGPRSHRQSLALCRALALDNIGTVVATPHQLGRFDGHTRPDVVRRTTEQLNRELAGEGIPLTVLPGAEVRLDERVVTLLAQDAILTLADLHRHLLLELPEETFIDIEPLVVQLGRQGIDLIIAHPERNVPLLEHQQAMWRWLHHGVTLQLTAGSLIGRFGRAAEHHAWALLEQGWAAVVATDAHDQGIAGPCMTAAFETIQSQLGAHLASLLCVGNPLQVLKGEPVWSPVFYHRKWKAG
jgi:protein-tyrosine phosphatase